MAEDPSPEDLLREIGERLYDPTQTAREQRVLVRHLASWLGTFDEVLTQFRKTPREPGKDDLLWP